jgi:heme oxygenase
MKEHGLRDTRSVATRVGDRHSRAIESVADDSRHTRLKRRCLATHAAIESVFDTRGFFTTREGYGRFLHGTYCFYLAFEQWAEGVGVKDLLEDWNERRKAPLLIKDRSAIGLTIDPAAIEMAVATIMSFSGNRAALLGGLYVTEGATLGATILARRAAKIGLTSRRGGSFLSAYGQSKSLKWQAFLEVLESADLGPARFEDVEAAALDTFDAYHRIVVRP